MRSPSTCLAVLLVATFAACGEPREDATRTITLTRGATLSVSTSVDGRTEVVATVPSGTDGAGTYASTDGSLVDAARDAKNALNEPGVTVRITVDGEGRLLAVDHARTR